MTEDDILVEQSRSHLAFLDKILSSHHHHLNIITGKEWYIWLSVPDKCCKWSHLMIWKYICINDVPKKLTGVFHSTINRKESPRWLYTHYTHSVIPFKMVVNICEVYLGVIRLATRKDVMWQVTNKKYSEQCTFWIVREQHKGWNMFL